METTNTNEGQKIQTSPATQAQTNSPNGVQSQAAEFIRQANEAREGLVKEREAISSLVAELRDLKATMILGGVTTGGANVPEPKSETPKEYVARVMREGYPDKAK